MGRKAKGTIVDKEKIYHNSYDGKHCYTEINYSIKFYDGNIIKLSRYNVQKI